MGKLLKPVEASTPRTAAHDDAEQLRLIADNVPAMSIAYDENLRCLFASRRFAEFFGFNTRNIVGKHLREIIGEDPYQEVKPYFDQVLAGRPVRYKRTRVLDNGDLRYLEVDLIPHTGRDGRSRGLFAVTADATERRRDEELRLLGYTAASLIAEAASSSAAIQAVIRTICECERWDCGRYFQAAGGKGPLRMLESWGIDDAAIQAFLERSGSIEYGIGEGLIGEVWESGRPLWISDVPKEPRARSKALSTQAQIRGAFVFPVQFQGRVTGVLIFNSRKSRPADEQLLQLILTIGSQIGQFLERKHAEERLRTSEERFRTVVDSAYDGIVIYDRALNIVSVNRAAERMIGVPVEQLLGKPGIVSVVPCIDEDGSPLGHEDRGTALVMSTGKPIIGRTIGVMRGAGAVTWLSVNTALVNSASGNEPHGAVSTLRDITANKRDEQLLRLEQQVTRVFTEEGNLSTAVTVAIRAICESEQWDCGRYLAVQDNVLKFFAAWSVPDPQVERYIEQSRNTTYASGVGMVGIAWRSAEPLWIRDIRADPRVARPALARDTGMCGAFTFPIVAAGTVIGVLIFQSQQIREPDARLLQAMRLIGAQIGQLVRRANAEEAMRQSEARFRSLCALASDIFWEQDAQYRFTAFHDPSGRTDPSGIIGKAPWHLGFVNVSAEDWAAHRAALDARTRFHDLEVCWRESAGEDRWYSMNGEPVFGASGAFLGYRGVGREITGRKEDEKRVQHLATHDALTGLPNRTLFAELLNVGLNKARRQGDSLAVMFIDLDGFKSVNDTLGHDVGDQVLKEVAMRLRETLRTSDVVARLGGDEFVALLQDVRDISDVKTVAGKIIAVLGTPVAAGARACTLLTSP